MGRLLFDVFKKCNKLLINRIAVFCCFFRELLCAGVFEAFYVAVCEFLGFLVSEVKA